MSDKKTHDTLNSENQSTTQNYCNTPNNPHFPDIERSVIKFWNTHKLFEKSVEIRNDEQFVFYDGPPFANGLPHYGHLLTGYIKDIYARYQTSKGKKVERRFGWDCHGLPAEMQSEKELGISGRIDIKEYGIDKFNSHCRTSVMKYTDEWEKYVNRQSRWVDFKNSYKTMDKSFMESVLWAFKELYKKGYVYEAMKVMPYSWKCETPLSNFETRLDNSYRERTDKAITVSFNLKSIPDTLKVLNQNFKIGDYKVLAWTTTPWTLTSNLALSVHEDITYLAIKKDGQCYILAKSSLQHYQNEMLDSSKIDGKDLATVKTQVIAEFKGKELVGIQYEPLFDYFQSKDAFKILHADFVVEGDGTGIVHIAPGFGEDDQILCSNNGIETVCPVDSGGKFTSEIYDFTGQNIFDTIDPIIIKIKEQGAWIKTEQYVHNYPHCWRTDTPLIYKAVSSWYIKVTAFKDRMIELNKQINWIPGHIKDGLFGKWLEGARDWAISRNRFWGTPLPIWKSNDPQYPRIDVYGSIEELERDFGVKVEDLHRPFIDELTRPNPDDPTGQSMMVRCEDVFDCWFESGSMPYGQVHYPFENKEWFENHFPADFIVEYAAQTRGWFYTLMVLSTALFDRPPFLNCICHGVILDSTGQKLSKRLNNYPDPLEIFEQYGSDALRFVFASSNVVNGQEFLIDKEGQMIYDAVRLYIKPIWNAYHFFTIYANADNVVAKISYNSFNILDRYILSKLKITVNKIDKSLSKFDSQSACEAIVGFFETLNNWYIRRSRSRFWKNEKDEDKMEAYNTLYTCIMMMIRSSASLIPTITEAIYLGLHKFDVNAIQDQGFVEKFDNSNSGDTPPLFSIHLTDFPSANDLTIDIDDDLVEEMDRVISICSAALFIRNKQNVRIRQPLMSLTIVTNDNFNLEMYEDLLSDELNVKNIQVVDDISKYATTSLKLNFPVIGKRLPHEVKNILHNSKVNNWTINQDETLTIGDVILNNTEYEIMLIPNDSKSMKSFSNNKGLIALDLNITDDLEIEGIYRDIVRVIQQSRKNAALHITDRISLNIQCNSGKASSNSDKIKRAIDTFKDDIQLQCLATFSDEDNYDKRTSVNILDEQVMINFSKV